MAHEQLYFMCNLMRVAGGQTLVQTAYLPESFAIAGKRVKLKRPDGSWQEHWQVVSGRHVSDTGRPAGYFAPLRRAGTQLE